MTAAQQRVGVALVRSAIAVPVICAIGYAVIEMHIKSGTGVHVASIAVASLVIFLVGYPLALTLGAALAIMFGERLQRGVTSVRYATVAFATIIGAVGVPLAWRYYGERDWHSIMLITGAVAGLVTGIVFCYLTDETSRDNFDPGAATPPSRA